MRGHPEGEPEAVLVLSTLGAAERRRIGGRRGRQVDSAEPEPVPTNRATVVNAEPFGNADQAARWLADVRDEHQRMEIELDRALRVLNRALHGYRVARADPHVRDVSVGQALVTRIGYGLGDELVHGRYGEAWELPREGRKVRRSMEAPEERFAAVLGAREQVLACEELVLRARMDIDSGRPREAALQARVALEALLAEAGDIPGERRGPLEADRVPVSQAANASLRGDLSRDLETAVDAAVERMESALRARRLSSSA